MEEACEATEGTMVALIGGEADAIAKLAEDCDVDISNRNAPGQTVLSGSVEGIEKVIAGAKEAGIRRAIPLPVAGAYHSRLMSSAQEKLAAELATAEISSPGIPVICNVESRQVTDAEDIRSTLERQVTGVVRWADSLRKLLELAPGATFVELGPDRALSGMLAKIDSEATSHAIGDMDSLDAAVSALA
jgi:[acyl-carrier-protein] S-malonyltransferase